MAHDIGHVTTSSDDTFADQSATVESPRAILTAVVDDISPDGVPWIVLTGESRSRSAATMMRFATAAEASEALLGRSVLVLLSAGDLPIVLGTVSERLWEQRGDEDVKEVRATLPAGQAMQLQADKRRVDLEATDEIRLTCGKSALVMRRDGTVIVRGVKIVSRASGTHRIMGATVGIN